MRVMVADDPGKSERLNFEQYESLNQSITIHAKLNDLFNNIVALSNNYRILKKPGTGNNLLARHLKVLILF